MGRGFRAPPLFCAHPLSDAPETIRLGGKQATMAGEVKRMQNTVTPAEVTAVISASIAVATFLIGRLTAMKEGVTDKARMGDRLDRIWETCSDTRDAVREMSRKLDDHSERLTRVEQQVQALSARVERVEDNCDARFRTGGTD